MIRENLQKLNEKINSLKNNLNLNYEIQLMCVSKTRSINEIDEAINAGQVLFGENRVLEAYEKFNSSELKNKEHQLHIIGHLQRNKAKKAVEIADMIQSIDKIETLDVIENICKINNKKIDFLIEINTSLESQKYGILPKNYIHFVENILKKSYSFCNLRGVMTVAPFTSDTKKIRDSFRQLFNIFNNIKDDIKKEDFNILSMGMSNDYEIAIQEGSNLIRIGTLIFGNRY
jgi:pyridoxal phosphate enzyme (YggS family)